VTNLVLSCSGPNTLLHIADRIAYSHEQAIILALIAIFSVVMWVILRMWKLLPISIIAMLLIHPYWSISALKGDCGRFKESASTFITYYAITCVVIQLVAWLWPSRSHKIETE